MKVLSYCFFIVPLCLFGSEGICPAGSPPQGPITQQLIGVSQGLQSTSATIQSVENMVKGLAPLLHIIPMLKDLNGLVQQFQPIVGLVYIVVQLDQQNIMNDLFAGAETVISIITPFLGPVAHQVAPLLQVLVPVIIAAEAVLVAILESVSDAIPAVGTLISMYSDFAQLLNALVALGEVMEEFEADQAAFYAELNAAVVNFKESATALDPYIQAACSLGV